MKIKIEIDENLKEQEVIIRAPVWNEEVVFLKERILGEHETPTMLNVRQKEREFFLPLSDAFSLSQNLAFFLQTASLNAHRIPLHTYTTDLRDLLL